MRFLNPSRLLIVKRKKSTQKSCHSHVPDFSNIIVFCTKNIEPEKVARSRTELYRNIDADYYGYRDEEDGDLLEFELEQEQERLEELAQQEDKEEKKEGEEEETVMDVDDSGYTLDGPIPDRKQIEEYLVNRRRQEVKDKKGIFFWFIPGF